MPAEDKLLGSFAIPASVGLMAQLFKF